LSCEDPIVKTTEVEAEQGFPLTACRKIGHCIIVEGCCDELADGLMRVLDGKLSATWCLPAFSVDASTAEAYQVARGSGNSGILSFAGELNPHIAQRWYRSNETHFWSDGFIKGFRETPKGSSAVIDVDSGPVLFGIGSVASAFGIGAARANGRFDEAAVLSLQVLAASWPTPFGPLIPCRRSPDRHTLL
jgi:hypothetical protein